MHCVLLPGLDGSGVFFKEFAESLAEDAHVSIISYPSDQTLSYEQLANYVDAKLPKEDFCLIAESFSGPVAIIVAARKPSHLRGMVLVATFAASPLRGLSPLFLKALSLVRMLSVPKSVISYFLLNGLRSDIAEDVRTVVNAMNKSVLIERLRNVLTCDVRHQLETITIPVLVIRANQDRLIGLQALSHRGRGITVSEVDAPHFVLQAKPAMIAETVIRPFLQSLRAA